MMKFFLDQVQKRVYKLIRAWTLFLAIYGTEIAEGISVFFS